VGSSFVPDRSLPAAGKLPFSFARAARDTAGDNFSSAATAPTCRSAGGSRTRAA